MQLRVFPDWISSPGNRHVSFLLVFPWLVAHFSSALKIPCCLDGPRVILSSHLLKDTWVAPKCWQIGIKLL